MTLAAAIETLIEDRDAAELVRDQVAEILAVESARQRQLATTGGKDAANWELNVFTERANPWSEFLDPAQGGVEEPPPNVNVWWDSTEFSRAGSNIEVQPGSARIHVDCYAAACSRDEVGGGHTPGDKLAALYAQRAARLCRKVLMAAHYHQLGMPELVRSRWVERVQVFQVEERETRSAQKVVGARVTLTVELTEVSPQVVPVACEGGTVTVQRGEGESAQTLFEASFPDPPS